jgi:hypothetical protein
LLHDGRHAEGMKVLALQLHEERRQPLPATVP